MMFAPLEGWRHVKVTDHHAAVDYAQEGTVGPAFSRRRQNRPGPRQSQHPHDRLALAAFPAPEARRLANRFEWHYWNTVYLGRAVAELRSRGEIVPDDHIGHIAPLGLEHIALNGDYVWPAEPLQNGFCDVDRRSRPVGFAADREAAHFCCGDGRGAARALRGFRREPLYAAQAFGS
jgi:Tn3 transposase DDE domain